MPCPGKRVLDNARQRHSRQWARNSSRIRFRKSSRETGLSPIHRVRYSGWPVGDKTRPMHKPHAVQFLGGPPSPLMVTVPYAGGSPTQLHGKVMGPNNPSFLFQSGKGPSLIGRYSFFGTDPYQVLTGKDGSWVLRTSDGREQRGQAPFDFLGQLCSTSSIARPFDAPPFFGGAVGYFSYDLVRQFENLPVMSV